MSTRVRLLLAVIICMIGSGLVGSPAMAAAPTLSVTTNPATEVTGTSATLHLTLTTSESSVATAFQYGATTSYGKTTPAVVTQVGSSHTASVTATITGLTPGTTYHFRGIATTGPGAAYGYYYYYSAAFAAGSDLTLATTAAGPGQTPGPTSTPAGKISFTGTTITVTGSTAAVKFKCASVKRCQGTVSLTKVLDAAKFRSQASVARSKTTKLGSKSFSARAGARVTVKVKLSKLALRVLKKAPKHTTSAKLTIKPKSGQKSIRNRAVKLRRK